MMGVFACFFYWMGSLCFHNWETIENFKNMINALKPVEVSDASFEENPRYKANCGFHRQLK